ncbi:MAG: hypothetical protein Fur0032_04510 [Terrimicrobiaceae bacterium]
MRFLAVFVIAVLGAAQTMPASAQTTALRALGVANRSVPGGELVEVSAERGSPQPQEWVFEYRDTTARGGTTEVGVDRGEVSWRRTPLRGHSGSALRPPIVTADWNIDSDKAFEIANREAVRNRLSFHWIDYRLEAQDGRGPIWSLRLLDRMGVAVASVLIDARDGTVVTPMVVDTVSPASQSTREELSQPIGGLIGDIRDLAIDVGKAARRGVLNVVGSAQEILTGERTIGVEEDR